MSVLILGVSGLIGHKLYQMLSKRFDRVSGTMHGSLDRFERFGLFDSQNIFEGVHVENSAATFAKLDEINPDIVLNCAGITRRRPEISNVVLTRAVNADFPHKLAEWAGEKDKRVIHFSTDCVFDGTVGNYDEDSLVTPEDLYGETKALGEIIYDHTLTIRSSFIGQELAVHSELLAWFLQQEGKEIGGFTNAMYTGVSTIEMSRVVGDIIERHQDLNGLYNLSISPPISKFNLLCHARDAYGINVEIKEDPSLVTNPTLNGDKLKAKIGVILPGWGEMMSNLASHSDLYD